jgi:transposase-like protein
MTYACCSGIGDSGQGWETLLSWSRSSAGRAGMARRPRIVLLAGEGTPNTEIAARVGVSRPTGNQWRERYATGGLAALV